MCQLSDGRRLKVHREQVRGRPSITDGHGLATSTTAGVEGTAVLLSTQREPSFAGSGILCFGCDVLEAYRLYGPAGAQAPNFVLDTKKTGEAKE